MGAKLVWEILQESGRRLREAEVISRPGGETEFKMHLARRAWKKRARTGRSVSRGCDQNFFLAAP